MATEFDLAVVGPEGEAAAEPVISLIAPGLDGYFGVLAGHEPMVAALRVGLLEYSVASGARHYVYIGGGFADVARTKVTILADEARHAREIEESEAERDLDEARRALKGEESVIAQTDAGEQVERATARLRAARLKH